MMEIQTSLDGIQMHVAKTSESGEVNAETIFNFVQNGSLISAHYSGGKVELGYLIGSTTTEGICFQFVQVDNAGRLDGGYSTYEVSRMDDGRVRLIEHFKWDSRKGSGTNIFKEIAANCT